MEAYIAVFAFGVVAVVAAVAVQITRKRRNKRREEEAARTDGTPFDPSILPDQVPGEVWSRK